LIANKITLTCRDIDGHIDTLPGITATESEQLKILEELEVESQELGRQIEEKMKEAKWILDKVSLF